MLFRSVTLYVNGSAVSPALAHTHGGTFTADQTLLMGSGSITMIGAVDQLRFWSRQLTAPEILALYNGGDGL